jgi:hypothetical protein
MLTPPSPGEENLDNNEQTKLIQTEILYGLRERWRMRCTKTWEVAREKRTPNKTQTRRKGRQPPRRTMTMRTTTTTTTTTNPTNNRKRRADTTREEERVTKRNRLRLTIENEYSREARRKRKRLEWETKQKARRHRKCSEMNRVSSLEMMESSEDDFGGRFSIDFNRRGHRKDWWIDISELFFRRNGFIRRKEKSIKSQKNVGRGRKDIFVSCRKRDYFSSHIQARTVG